MRERDHLGDPGVDGRIILIWILRKWDMGAWTALIWLRIWTGVRRFGQQIRNTWEVLKCGAGEGWRRSVGPIT